MKRVYEIKKSRVGKIVKTIKFRNLYQAGGKCFDTHYFCSYELLLDNGITFECQNVYFDGDYVLFETDELDGIELLKK